MMKAFLILGLAAAGLGAALAMMIVDQVSKRGVKINYPLLRGYLFKYINQYARMTREETGKTGPLYAPCIAAFILAAVFAVLALIIR